MEHNKIINCVKCVNYQVTWNKNFPHGCSLWKVQSKNQPKIIVQESTGKPCQYFEEKNK
ncbi:MAG: uracil-DNA glycosylase [Candidatus Wallbacteria bacterium]